MFRVYCKYPFKYNKTNFQNGKANSRPGFSLPRGTRNNLCVFISLKFLIKIVLYGNKYKDISQFTLF